MRGLMLPCIVSVFLLAGCGGKNASLIRISETQIMRLDTAKKAALEMTEKARATQKRLFEALGAMQKKQQESAIGEAQKQLMQKYFPDASAITPEQLSSFLDEWRTTIEREGEKLRSLLTLEQASDAALKARDAEIKRLFLVISEAQQLLHEFVINPGVGLTPLINQILQPGNTP